MSNVVVSLLNKKFAPWGLLTDEPKPRILLWLTETDPSGEIDSELLSLTDIERLSQGFIRRIIDIQGLEDYIRMPTTSFDERSEAPHIPPLPETVSKPASNETVFDVMALIKKEEELSKVHASILKKKVEAQAPDVEKTLSMGGKLLKKKLKELAQKDLDIFFFQACKKQEETGRKRSSVISVLTDIIKSKMTAIELLGRAGQEKLDKLYYEQIEEFPEEDTEIIIPV